MAEETLREPQLQDEIDDTKQDRPWWIVVTVVFFAVVGLALYRSTPEEDPEIFLYQIVVIVDADLPDDRDRAWTKINRVREELLVPGKGFGAVALREGESQTAHQDDPGEIGWVGRGVLPPHIEEVAFALEVEEISEIIEDSFGFRVLTISERRGFLDAG